MKRILMSFIVCAVLAVHSASYAGANKTEVSLVEINETFTPDYLDMITTDVTPDTTGMTLVFELGNQTIFDNAIYYYFYQIENYHSSFLAEITEFYLPVNTSQVKAVGYIVSHDLDTPSTFDHNIIGENEVTGGSIVDVDSVFADTGLITWTFASNIALNDESTVLFVASDFAPVSAFATAQGIDSAFEGDVLVPGAVPEPSAMLLFGFGLAAYIRKRLRK